MYNWRILVRWSQQKTLDYCTIQYSANVSEVLLYVLIGFLKFDQKSPWITPTQLCEPQGENRSTVFHLKVGQTTTGSLIQAARFPRR